MLPTPPEPFYVWNRRCVASSIIPTLQGCAVMRYSELKTWEDFAKALSQNPDPRSLTYLIDGLKRALEEDERKIIPKPPRSKAA
jgi:hypothetical protein